MSWNVFDRLFLTWSMLYCFIASFYHTCSTLALILYSWGCFTKLGFWTSLSGMCCHQMLRNLHTGRIESKIIGTHLNFVIWIQDHWNTSAKSKIFKDYIARNTFHIKQDIQCIWHVSLPCHLIQIWWALLWTIKRHMGYKCQLTWIVASKCLHFCRCLNTVFLVSLNIIGLLI